MGTGWSKERYTIGNDNTNFGSAEFKECKHSRYLYFSEHMRGKTLIVTDVSGSYEPRFVNYCVFGHGDKCYYWIKHTEGNDNYKYQNAATFFCYNLL